MCNKAQTKRSPTGKNPISCLTQSIFKEGFRCVTPKNILLAEQNEKTGQRKSVHNWSGRPHDCGLSYCWDFSKSSYYGIFLQQKWILSDNKYKPLKNLWLKMCMFEQLYRPTSQRVNTSSLCLPAWPPCSQVKIRSTYFLPFLVADYKERGKGGVGGRRGQRWDLFKLGPSK